MRAAFVTLFILLTQSACGALQAAELKEWRDLSNRKVSRTGEIALAQQLSAWRHAESENFIYHVTDPERAAPVLEQSEAYASWVTQFLGAPAVGAQDKIHVFAFSEKAEWETFKQKASIRLKGSAFTNGRELYLFVDPFWLEPKRSIAHELAHVVFGRSLDGPLPLFLNEGFAEYAATRAVAVAFGGDEYRVHLRQPVAADRWIPIRKLVSLKDYPEGEEELFYRQSQELVRYLVQRKDRTVFTDLVRRVSAGERFEDALRNAYGLELAGLEEALRALMVRDDAAAPG